MRIILLEAIRKKAEGIIAEKQATVELMLHKPVAIGEHTNVHYIEDLYKAIEEYENAKSILETFEDFK